MTKDVQNLRFYETTEHSCSYLEEKKAKTLFVDPDAEMTAEIYSALSVFGFRRSGGHVYRPRCGACQACIPVRVPVDAFKPSRSQRRCLKRNADIELGEALTIFTEKHYGLYERYINERHQDGDMYPPSVDQYEGFLTNEWGVTRYIEMTLDGKLIGLAVTDTLSDGLSAVYTFFEPNLAHRGLGAFGILCQIRRAQALQLPYVYLGYWIKDSSKMNYKSQYRPLQMFVNNRWIEVK